MSKTLKQRTQYDQLAGRGIDEWCYRGDRVPFAPGRESESEAGESLGGGGGETQATAFEKISQKISRQLRL